MRWAGRIRATGDTEYRPAIGSVLLRLDVDCPDYLTPLLGFFGDELSEVGGRARKRGAAQVGKARLDTSIGEASIDLPVELLDDFGRRIPRHAQADPSA